jgi:hypothetical protein
MAATTGDQMILDEYIVCPWCGTHYQSFQSNCKNCGGPILPHHMDLDSEDAYILPPPAPRPVPDSYALKLLLTDGWGVTLIIFLFLGAVFSFLGVSLTIAVVTMFVGLPFLGIGLVFFLVGLVGLLQRGQIMQNTVRVLQHGIPVRGEILDVEENTMVTVNNRHPWKITYQFSHNDNWLQGEISTLNPPGMNLQPEKPVCVLYLPDQPGLNTLYPHP